ncbi:MAG: hypothetical protein GY820_22355 [Gammaproteobacteria bacterium]|nr:hypothetical protein [Gammaproteobacteria bacterium]
MTGKGVVLSVQSPILGDGETIQNSGIKDNNKSVRKLSKNILVSILDNSENYDKKEEKMILKKLYAETKISGNDDENPQLNALHSLVKDEMIARLKKSADKGEKNSSVIEALVELQEDGIDVSDVHDKIIEIANGSNDEADKIRRIIPEMIKRESQSQVLNSDEQSGDVKTFLGKVSKDLEIQEKGDNKELIRALLCAFFSTGDIAMLDKVFSSEFNVVDLIGCFLLDKDCYPEKRDSHGYAINGKVLSTNEFSIGYDLFLMPYV